MSQHPKRELERFRKDELFHYREDRTPSRAANIPGTHEVHYLEKTGALIWGMGERLRCGELSRMTAVGLMARFFMRRAVSGYSKEVVASACLLVASKQEDQNRLLGDVARTHLRYLNKPPDEAALKRLSEEIAMVERELIHELGRDLNLVHPHYYIASLYKHFRRSKPTFSVAVSLASLSAILPFFNLQFDPPLVAMGCLYLAAYQTSDSPVSEMLPQWASSLAAHSYKDVAKALHRQIIATPQNIKTFVGFKLGAPLFDSTHNGRS